jgi:hypothetical protein
MNTWNITDDKGGLLARKADNLTAICEPISRKRERLVVYQPNLPPRLVTGLDSPSFFLIIEVNISFLNFDYFLSPWGFNT